MLQTAIDLMQQGQPAEAIATLERAVEAARAAHGEQSFPYAEACAALGSILTIAGDDERAAEMLEAASLTPWNDAELEKQRLTVLLNLAEVELRRGNEMLAEDAIRRSLTGRKALYGPSHPGYAFGLVPLAQVLLARRKPYEAREAAREAVANFRHHAHPRLPSALALLAEIDAALGKDPLREIADLPDGEWTAAATVLLDRADGSDPEVLQPLLRALGDAARARLSPGHPLTREAFTKLANLEAAGGDLELRAYALSALLEGCLHTQDVRGMFEAKLGLALVEVERGDFEAAGQLVAETAAELPQLDEEARRQWQQVEAIGATRQQAARSARATDQIEAAARALEARVLALAPDGLLARVHAHFDEERAELAVDVELLQEATDLDKQRVEQAIARARREIFQTLAEGRALP